MEHAIPVLVGVGQVTERDPDLEKASSPLDLMEQASRLAMRDAGLTAQQFEQVDQLIVVRGIREGHRDTPRALGERLSASRAERWLVPHGGNGPQQLVNRFAEAIAEDRARLVLLTGSEAIASARKILKSGAKPSWPGHLDSDAPLLFPDYAMSSPHERIHDMERPANAYPMFETALRAHYGRSIDEHQLAIGRLFEPFSKTAAASPYAWLPIERTAEEVCTASPQNRYVTWPYTKFMNANNQINQAAALLMTSTVNARALGIPERNWVYLHGCAEASEIAPVSLRMHFHDCPAIGAMGNAAFEMANRSISDIAHFDLYSCFPSAVQIAADELGIAHDDARGLTITGGLPFHGGAGNNYVMNSIAAMVERLRGARETFGLVTANGGQLGKHAMGIYSTTPREGSWKRRPAAEVQATIDALPRATLDERPTGPATLEAYSVVFDRSGAPQHGIVMGRLSSEADTKAKRFIANVMGDRSLLDAMTREEFVGRTGRVETADDTNQWHPGA